MSKRRILAWILSVAMVVTMTPTLAFAKTTGSESDVVSITTLEYQLVTDTSKLNSNDEVIVTIEKDSDYYAIKNATITSISGTDIPDNLIVTGNLVSSKTSLLLNESDSDSLSWTLIKTTDTKLSFKNKEDKYLSMDRTKAVAGQATWSASIVGSECENDNHCLKFEYVEKKIALDPYTQMLIGICKTTNKENKEGRFSIDQNGQTTSEYYNETKQAVRLYKKVDSPKVLEIKKVTERTYNGKWQHPNNSKNIPTGCVLKYSSNTSVPESDVASSASIMDWRKSPKDFLIDANVTDSNIGDGEEVYVGLFLGSTLIDYVKVKVKILPRPVTATVILNNMPVTSTSVDNGEDNFVDVTFTNFPKDGEPIQYEVNAKNTCEDSNVIYTFDKETNTKDWKYGTYKLSFTTDTKTRYNKNYSITWTEPAEINVMECLVDGGKDLGYPKSGLKMIAGYELYPKGDPKYGSIKWDMSTSSNVGQLIDGTYWGKVFKLISVNNMEDSASFTTDDERATFKKNLEALKKTFGDSSAAIANIVYVDLYTYAPYFALAPVKGVELNELVEFEIPYYGAEVGRNYNVYHYDVIKGRFDEMTLEGYCGRENYVRVMSKSFSPFVIVDTKNVWYIEFEAENSGIYFTYENGYDGIGHAVNNKDYEFQVVVPKEYGAPVVKDGNTVMTASASTTDSNGNAVYSYILPNVSSAHRITATAEKLNTVNYSLNGGNCASLTTFEKYANGATVTVSSEAPTKDGYTFAGWKNSVDGKTYTAGTSFVIKQNVYLTAQWTPVTFKVTYSNVGTANVKGTLPTDGIAYLDGETVTVSGNTGKLSLDGYIFKGWYDGNGNIYKPGEKFQISANTTLTAYWEKGYTVTYYNNEAGTTGVTPIDKSIYEKDTVIYVMDNIGSLSKDGYTFNGWKVSGTDVVYKPDAPISIDKDYEFVADWTKGYTVHFDLGDGAGKNGNPVTITDQLVVPGDKLNSVGIIKGFTVNVSGTDVDYYFCGWQSQNGTYWDFENDKVEKGSFTSGSKEMTLKAVWSTKLHYDIVFDDNLDSPLSDYVTINEERGNNKGGKYTVANVEQGKTITKEKLPTFERVDYKFDGWYLDKECSADKKFDYTKAVDFNNLQYYANNDDQVTVYAKWTPLYSEKDDVVIIDNQKFEGTYNTYFSDWIEAYRYNGELDEIKTPVYRNFYLKTGDKLPDGLYLNKRTGEIYGIPEKVGTTEVTVMMYNDDVQQIAASKKITIVIKPNTLKIDHIANVVYDKDYGVADPDKLLKNLTNLDVDLAIETVNYVKLQLSDADNSMNVDYSYVTNNNLRAKNADAFANAATKGNLIKNIQFAKDLANPTVATAKTDIFTLDFHRVLGEDAKDYKLYMNDDDVTLSGTKGAAIEAIGYEIDIANGFEAKDVTNSTNEKYVFTINKAVLNVAISNTNISKSKTYGYDDPAYYANEFKVTAENSTTVDCSASDNTVTIAYTGANKASFTDVIKLDLQRETGEDVGSYHYYLRDSKADYVFGVNTDKTTGVDNADPINNYDISVNNALILNESDNANNALTINTRNTKFNANITKTYGEMKFGDAVEGSFISAALADNAAIKVADGAVVKLAAETSMFSTSGKLKAGSYTTIDALDIAISNSANPIGTKAVDTKSNYEITPDYSIVINKKQAELTSHTINITKYHNATEQNIKDLVTVGGIIDGDEANLNITSYVIDGSTYSTAAAAAAALIKVHDDVNVTVNYNNFVGTDADNYFAAGSSIVGIIHPVAEVVGGGSVDTVKTVTIDCKVGDGGSITPLPNKSKEIEVNKGDSKTITITPNKGYSIADVVVDGESVGAVSEYTFKKVITEHSIEVTFKAASSYTSPYKEGYKECAKSSTCPMSAYNDISAKDWFHDGVHFCLENGYMNGVDKTIFNPDGTTTRGMLVTILYRMDGSKSVSGNNPFKDVNSDDWFYDAVLWASQNGIVKGYDSTTFGPNNNVTREQVAAILARYAEYKGINVYGRGDLAGYTDVEDISSWALDDVRWAISERLMNGYTESTIEPGMNATRAQIATLIMRLCENVL